MNEEGRYLQNYIDGETTYDWGNGSIQPDKSPTASVTEEKHRNFVINPLRWLYCTQLRWIENYYQNNPEWSSVSGWSKFVPDSNWIASGKGEWEKPPQKNTVTGKFNVHVPKGVYILSLAILNPAGQLPGVRFATANYLNGGRHLFGIVDFTQKQCFNLPDNFHFDDPEGDNSLHYTIQ